MHPSACLSAIPVFTPRTRLAQSLAVLAFAIGAVAIAGPARAAEVYKCPTPTGRVEFRDRPCDGAKPGEKLEVKPAAGEARPVPPPAAGTADGASALTDAAAKQRAGEKSIEATIRKQNEQLERDRQAREDFRRKCQAFDIAIAHENAPGRLPNSYNRIDTAERIAKLRADKARMGC